MLMRLRIGRSHVFRSGVAAVGARHYIRCGECLFGCDHPHRLAYAERLSAAYHEIEAAVTDVLDRPTWDDQSQEWVVARGTID